VCVYVCVCVCVRACVFVRVFVCVCETPTHLVKATAGIRHASDGVQIIKALAIDQEGVKEANFPSPLRCAHSLPLPSQRVPRSRPRQDQHQHAGHKAR
jgi:hypothetical protein